jgi:hypothetical protein
MAEVLRYPYEALTEKTDYLQIDAKAYTPIGGGLVGRKYAQTRFENVTFGGAGRKNIQLGTVFLPIPSNIQDGNAVTYSDDSLNGIVAGAVSNITALTSVDLNSETAGKDLASGVGGLAKMLTNPSVKEAYMRSIAAQAVSVLGGNVTPDQLLARQTGEIFNPNMELLFNGVTLRAFKFQFKLTPRDGNEADEIRNIIRFFKYNMSPQTGTGSPAANEAKSPESYFLKTPNVFQLTYKQGSKEHPFLHKFKLCALESMAVNYTGENVYATYGDGTPVSMIMDLSFKELEPIYADDYSDNTKEGVGY